MKKNKMVLALALGLIVTMCTACGASKPQTTKTEDPTQKAPVTIKFMYWGSPFEKKVLEKSFEDFHKKYSWITVEGMYTPASYTDKLTTMIAGNVAPDAGYVSDSVVLKWGEEGKFLNLNDFLSKDKDLKQSDFLDTSFYKVSSDNTVGLLSATESLGLMYNKDIFEKAGIELPPTKAEEAWSWDKFVEVCKKLTIDENGKNALDPSFDSKKIKQYGFQFDNYLPYYMSGVMSNDGNFISKDGKDFGLTDPKAIEALQKYADLINVDHVAPSPVQMKSIPDTSIALASKKIAMTLSGNWALLDFAQQDFKMGIGVLPKFADSKTLISGGSTSIFKTTKHPEEAWLLLKWLANPETSLELYSSGLWMPVLKSWYTKPELLAKWATGNKAHPDEYVDAMVKPAMNKAVVSPAFNVKNYGEIRAIVDPALDKVWLGQQSAKDAMNSIADKVKPLVKGYYGK